MSDTAWQIIVPAVLVFAQAVFAGFIGVVMWLLNTHKEQQDKWRADSIKAALLEAAAKVREEQGQANSALSKSLDKNNEVTDRIHDAVNSGRTAMIEEANGLRQEIAALKAQIAAMNQAEAVAVARQEPKSDRPG